MTAGSRQKTAAEQIAELLPRVPVEWQAAALKVLQAGPQMDYGEIVIEVQDRKPAFFGRRSREKLRQAG